MLYLSVQTHENRIRIGSPITYFCIDEFSKRIQNINPWAIGFAAILGQLLIHVPMRATDFYGSLGSLMIVINRACPTSNVYSMKNVLLCLLWLAISFGCVSTREDSADIAIQQAGANAHEIRKVLTHYDDARDEASEYLVKTMIGRYGISGDGLDSIENLFKELPVNGV